MRRRTAALLATVLATVTMSGVVGCGAYDRAVDCVETADSVAQNVNNLQIAVLNLDNDPDRADRALDDIDKNLDGLGKKTHKTDVNKVVDDLGAAVGNVRKSVDNGDKTPDISPVKDAAGELTSVCAS